MQSIYLDIDRPALDSAADWLLDHHTSRGAADMGSVTLVVPGGRAGRRLLEILVDRAEARQRMLVPPEIITAHHLPERLYEAQRPFANELTQQLAWAAALQKIEPECLSRITSRLPEPAEQLAWLEFGRLFRTLHRELASDGLNFQDVLAQAQSLPGTLESERWEVLTRIQRAYLGTLDQLGLWDRQTARRVAVDRHECRAEQPIIVLGLVDMNRILRQMLDQVAEHVTLLVHAPSDWSVRFDSHGCLIPEAWQDLDLGINDDDIIDADGPEDECRNAIHWLAGLEEQFRADEITIGVADERLLPHLMRQLDACHVPHRFGPGQPTVQSGVMRLLEALAAFATRPRYAHFAALLRHPDLEAWLLHRRVRMGWIDELDAYYQDHLPVTIDGRWLGKPCTVRKREGRESHDDGGDSPSRTQGTGDPAHPANERLGLAAAYEQVSALIGSWRGQTRPLVDWLKPIAQLLLELYGWRTFDTQDRKDRRTYRACQQMLDAVHELSQVPTALQPKVNSQEVVQLLRDRLGGERIAEPATDAAVELVGWLELSLDDAPALLVTSLNEGFVPTSVNADLFLPGSLRAKLGLDDNARRFARDAYALATLLAPWRRTALMVARRDLQHDPQTPSRLLFAADAETVARRALRLFSDVSPPMGAGSPAKISRTQLHSRAFERPRPVRLADPIQRLPVTAFRAYLACPYRFYLRHVLRLSATDDQAVELDGARFGTLAHRVLERFGRSELRDATDAKTMECCLQDLLASEVRGQYGTHRRAAVQVQIEQLWLRLRQFAQWQAGRAAQGWRIEYTEFSTGDRSGRLDVDGKPFYVTGRIDRIDMNMETGERWILDYKTSDSGDDPEKTHRRSKKWMDLQLPLYRYLARAQNLQGTLHLGYIILPKDVSKVGLSPATWSDSELRQADDVACDVVRRIRRQVFEPPTMPPPDFSEDLAGICRDGVFGSR